MDYCNRLKLRIKKNIELQIKNQVLDNVTERPNAYIFCSVADNFNAESYKNIDNKPLWRNRLTKSHTQIANTKEMQSSNSSDALLMNIFCFPSFQDWKGTRDLFKVESFSDFVFGWNPDFKNENKSYPTEIDLHFNDVIVEAKLTEPDFQTQKANIVEAYENFNVVFDEELLDRNEEGDYKNYQLIRNILTAYKNQYRFYVLIDES